MKRDDLDRLAQLTGLVAARDRMRLDDRDREGVRLRAALKALEADAIDPLPKADLSVAAARDYAAWRAWRTMEQRRLQIALARHEASVIPLRTRLARSTARDRVVDALRKRSGD